MMEFLVAMEILRRGPFPWRKISDVAVRYGLIAYAEESEVWGSGHDMP